jgi:small subunit ribosomal protein S9
MAEKDKFYATGRRKTSTAKVWIRPGIGNFKVNGKELEDYFDHRATLIGLVKSPLEVTGNKSGYDVIVRVLGGGKSGQAGAVCHGLARALVQAKADLRNPLKSSGLLTRDPRSKERKKYGQPGARKKFQFSKR